MSKVIACSRPEARAASKAPATPPAGPGEHRAHGVPSGLRRADAAAVRLHDAQPRRRATRRGGVRESGLEGAEVARHRRGDIRVGDRRAHPLELAVFRQHLVRDGAVQAGRSREAAGQLGEAALVVRVHEREERADRDRVHPGVGDRAQDALGGGLVERLDDLAVGGDALGDLETQLLGHEGRRAGGVEGVEVGPRLAADHERVAEALGGDQRGARAAAREQRVGGDRGAVHHLPRRPPGLGDPGEHGARGVVGRRGALGDAQRLAVPVEEVGERAADIDAEQADGARRTHVLRGAAPATSAAGRGRASR